MCYSVLLTASCTKQTSPTRTLYTVKPLSFKGYECSETPMTSTITTFDGNMIYSRFLSALKFIRGHLNLVTDPVH